MKLPRRNFLRLAAGASVLPAVSRIARAQDYPARPVRIIVPFPAGQATDTIARLMGQSLSERLGQAFVIENRTGAGGQMQKISAGKFHLNLPLASHHSITSSASASNLSGMVSPSAFAVLRLMANW